MSQGVWALGASGVVFKGGIAQAAAVFSRHTVTASNLPETARDFESEAFWGVDVNNCLGVSG